MITIALQIFAALLSLSFGLAALAAARLLHTSGSFPGAAWRLTGIAFTASGATFLAQTLLAAVAFAAGPGATVHRLYMAIAPAGNYGRNLLMIVFAVALLLLPSVRSPLDRRTWMRIRAALAAALLLGGAWGAWEGFEYGPHFQRVAVLNLALLLLLLAALLRLLAAQVADWLLWCVLVLYAIAQSIGILWTAAVVWFGLPGMWSPSPRMLVSVAALTYAGMLALTLRRRSLAARRVQVGGLLDPPAASRSVVNG